MKQAEDPEHQLEPHHTGYILSDNKDIQYYSDIPVVTDLRTKFETHLGKNKKGVLTFAIN